MPLSTLLTSYIDKFALLLPNGTASNAYTSLLDALNNSEWLQEETELAALNRFTKIVPMDGSSGAAAAYFPGDTQKLPEIRLAVDASGNLLNNQTIGTFVILLGHEVKHANHRETVAEARQSFTNGVTELAQKTGMQEYTQLLLTSQSVSAYDEAVAHITGWNDLVSYMRGTNPQFAFRDLLDQAGGYRSYFVDSNGAPVTGLTINAGYTISLNAENIAAVGATFFFNPSTRFQFGLTYPEYYSKSDLKFILSQAPEGKVALDFDTLHLDPAKLQSFNSMGLTSGVVRTIYDPISLTTYDFKGTDTGVTRSQSKPIPYPEGEKTEIHNYSEDGSFDSLEYRWTDADGGSGSSKTDKDGNYSAGWKDADGTQFWTNTHTNGAYDSGFYDHGTLHVDSHQADGSFSIYTNFADGTFVREYRNPDGSYGSSALNADGSGFNYSFNADGTYDKWSEDASGHRIEDQVGGGGYTRHADRYQDGSSHEEEHSADGTVTISDNDGHGTVLTDVSNGAYHLSTTSSTNGYFHSYLQPGDGTFTEIESDSAGNYKKIWSDPDGSVTSAWQHANGDHGTTWDGANGGTYYETNYAPDVDGVRLTETTQHNVWYGYDSHDLTYSDGRSIYDQTSFDGLSTYHIARALDGTYHTEYHEPNRDLVTTESPNGTGQWVDIMRYAPGQFMTESWSSGYVDVDYVFDIHAIFSYEETNQDITFEGIAMPGGAWHSESLFNDGDSTHGQAHREAWGHYGDHGEVILDNWVWHYNALTVGTPFSDTVDFSLLYFFHPWS
ncbi:hypothetical protein [Pseudoduganella rhizocola]|uniref:hypothetical protein n=1 Tax=Pseudoduganella rhizocola TaxID=3382643 RepID=UPI0038B564CE